MQNTTTIGDRLRSTGGFSSGFDYIRLTLSLLVMFVHSFSISGDDVTRVLPWGLDQLLTYSILPMFFALSGFLVAASLVRTQALLPFLTLRGLRILPALMMEILLSALVLGPLLTTVSLRDYFTHIEFFQYFLNIAGYIHYHLPGVFIDNPVPRTVNGSLWTVPYEAECYLALAAISLIGLVKRPKLFAAVLAIALVGLFVWTLIHGDTGPARNTLTGRQLVLFFLAGVLTYLWRDRVPYSGWLAIAAAGVSLLLVTSHLFVYLLPLPVAYITAWIGLQMPKKLPIIFKGDYSYGIYLYAFPVQQAVAYLMPQSHSWIANFAVALVFVSLFAAFSWHCVEKPTLRLKRFVVAKAGGARPADQNRAGHAVEGGIPQSMATESKLALS